MIGRKARLLAPFALALSLFGVASCGGGGGTPAAIVGCGNLAQGMCVTRCNLGCTSSGGCSISEIAVNQPLSWDFNLEINADTVNSNTIKMRTSAGDEPVGSFVVQSNSVFFFPEARVIGGQTFFGFKSGETYTLTIPSGKDALETIESMSGDKIAKTFTCRLKVTRGIVDFDGKPPTASMLIPGGSSVCEPPNTLILVEFSEIVDAATLLGDAKTAGVTYGLAQFDSLGNCANKSIAITGTRTISVNKATQRTRLLFRPAFELPPSFCVRVQVSDRVRDLSGKRAKPITFEFKTCEGNIPERVLTEKFNDTSTRDELRSGAKWVAGNVTPAILGGSGRLGDFSIAFGGKDTGKNDADGRRIWEWNTDKTTVPGVKTLSGNDETVTNGIFEFTTFDLRQDLHLRFTGSKVPLIKVTGRMQVDGTISASAPDTTKLQGSSGKPPKNGQPGFAGAIGGGKGGRGGDSPHKTGTKDINGSNGETVKLPAGHPLANEIAGAGGKGSKAHPASGLDKDVCFTAYVNSISQQATSGGSGGSFVTVGGVGSVIDNKKNGIYPPAKCDFGPNSTPSKAVPISKLFARTEKSSFLYLIGGSGGGGAGTHAHGSFDSRPTAVDWSPGSGGAGGGGPIHLQIGGDLIVSTKGMILARGGKGQQFPFDSANFTNPAPGGAGSGGSILIQIGGLPTINGAIDARGGEPGRLDGHGGPQNFKLRVDSLGGRGGDGFIRFEATPRIDPKRLGNLQPPAKAENSAVVHKGDYDPVSLLATKWLDTNLFFPPKWLRYEIDAVIDSVPVRFSDAEGGKRADNTQPVTFIVQGAQLDPETKRPDPETVSKWFVGTVDPLNRDGGNGVRYLIRFNKNKASSITIKEVRVYYKG